MEDKGSAFDGLPNRIGIADIAGDDFDLVLVW